MGLWVGYWDGPTRPASQPQPADFDLEPVWGRQGNEDDCKLSIGCQRGPTCRAMCPDPVYLPGHHRPKEKRGKRRETGENGGEPGGQRGETGEKTGKHGGETGKGGGTGGKMRKIRGGGGGMGKGGGNGVGRSGCGTGCNIRILLGTSQHCTCMASLPAGHGPKESITSPSTGSPSTPRFS